MRLPTFFLRRPVVLAGLALQLTVSLLSGHAQQSYAFAPPGVSRHGGITIAAKPPALSFSSFGSKTMTTTSTTTSSSLQALPDPASSSLMMISDSAGLSDDPLMTYFLQTLITAGVPAALSLLVIVVTALLFRPNKSNPAQDLEDSVFGQKNPVSLLYRDLYGDQDQSLAASNNNKNKSFWARLFQGGGNNAGNNNPQQLPQNVGVPADQYIRLTHLNQQYESYQYSVQAATTSQAAAAATYRQTAAARAWTKAWLPAASQLSAATLAQLQQAERDFLKAGQPLLTELRALQTALTNQVVNQELEESLAKHSKKKDGSSSGTKKIKKSNDDADGSFRNGPNDYPLDPEVVVETTTKNAGNTTTSTSNATATSSTKKQRGGKKSVLPKSETLSHISKLQRQLQELELDFVQTIIQQVGPEHAAAIRTALMGDMAVRGAGQLLLTDLVDRPLKSLFVSSNNSSTDESSTPTAAAGNLFVTRFPGDATASQVATLREEVTAVIGSARPGVDEALVVLQTGGGTVTGYGLAAAQLLRLKEAGLKLTIAVEQVAASGGYMMTCVADKIVASPFAVLGSIGVISDIPNVYERLKQEGIEFQTVTAGKYKRTLTPTKKVTAADFSKTKQDLEDVLVLFRDFVAENRPQLDIDAVATGETWFGKAALDRKLCDEIKTVDAVLTDYVKAGFEVYEVEYKPPVETIFGKVVPASANAGISGSNDDTTSGLIGQGVRWLVRTIAAEIKAELGSELGKVSTTKPIQERYMMMDDSGDRVKSQD